MTIEYKNDGTNNSYPATVYGTTVVGETSKFGAKVGSPSTGKYTVEYVFSAGDAVAATEYANLMLATLPAGFVVKASKVYATETFDAAANVGVVKKGDGTGAVAAAVYTGTPTVGTQEDGTLLSPLTEVLVDDYVVTFASAATTGKAKVVIELELATADVPA
jgi:hypothetical protein